MEERKWSYYDVSSALQVGFLLHWESLLSTHGDEQGMLEDFIVAIADINQLTFKVHMLQISHYTPGFIFMDVLCPSLYGLF